MHINDAWVWLVHGVKEECVEVFCTVRSSGVWDGGDELIGGGGVCCVLACRQRLCAYGCVHTWSELGVGLWEVWSAGALGVWVFGQGPNMSVFLCGSQETMISSQLFLRELEGCAKVLPL